MRYRALKLEVFGATPVAASAPSDVDVEEVRLAGYETGYQSGWDDATTEREKSDQLIAADLERNLRDISFTYTEARNEVLTGLGGLFSSILSQFLPAIAAEAVGPIVDAELAALTNDLGEARCELLAAPRTVEQLGWLAERHMEIDLRLTPEPAFADGRVALRFAGEAREIDLSAMVDAMATAIRDFTQQEPQEEERRNA
ncbi:hypothetical protein [Alterinioella nitratireducens]|jgi:flagellar assembly protein FliH|uniref:hypothetical protein n=1 Tax=Alterinioella nitratireducens TaxID=2735915 RepID=UPI0040597255